MIPNTKISSALFEFARPIIDEVDKNTTKEQIEKGIEVAVGVWNAVIYDAINKHTHYTSMMRNTISRPDVVVLFERFIDRKKVLFPNDLRMIADFKIEYEDGYLNIQAKGSVDKRLMN
jgi:hypothetical protein